MISRTVSVNFLGTQRQTTGEDTIAIEISGDMRVRDIIEIVKDRYPELDLDESNILITVNQEKAASDTILQGGDVISFVPHIGGG
ncbi:MoaD/ThiS family protein [Chloroflexota bacterium]